MKKPPTSSKPLRSVPKPEPTPAPTPAASEEKESPIDSRLNIPLDKDGRVLVGNMRDTSKAKLKELVTNSALAAELGVSPDAAPHVVGMALPAELMYPLVHGLSIIGVMLVGKITNAPRDIVEKVVPFSKDEVEAIAPAFADVLNKYAGASLTKYKEEVALLGLVAALGIRKVSLVQDEMARGRRRDISIVPMAGDVKDKEKPS